MHTDSVEMTTGKATYSTYRQKDVVDYYDAVRDLQQAEKELFDSYVKPGQRVLDIGVGAGRTTRFLAPQAEHYVGVDYSDAMVERCRERFPGVEFHCMDAANMSKFADASFDVVLFSFNGLGTLPTDEARASCVKECARVLKRGGMFLFSLHNPRYIVFSTVLRDVGMLKKVWRLTYAAMVTSRNLYHRLPSRAFWKGSGYVVDPGQHNALTIFVCEPKQVEQMVGLAGFQLLKTLPAPVPRPAAAVPHYYYACKKA